MAESIPFAELELRIAFLPPVSRGAHLGGPAIHAERLVELWKIEAGDDVPLEQAFRLLDAETVAGVILRATLAKDAGVEAWTVEHLAKFWDAADNNDGEAPAKDYPSDPRYWTFPSLSGLLFELQELCWEALLDGVWRTEALKIVRGKIGKTPRVISPIELPRLRPDWKLSRLCRGDQDEWLDVRVRRTSVEPPAERQRPSQAALRAELKRAMEEIAQGYSKGVRPPFKEIEAALKTRLPWVTRRQAREAVAKYTPQLHGERGRPRKSPN